jgi:hypothetical protein
MNQTIAMYAGALVGAVIWLIFRTVVQTLGAFLCIVISAWAAVGIYGLVCGEVSIAGRGGRSPKTFVGTATRLVGLAILALSAAFTFVMMHVDRSCPLIQCPVQPQWGFQLESTPTEHETG